jgi:hypothetical protein
LAIDPLEIPGGLEIVQHFGRWPIFHDAEVLTVHLSRSGVSHIRIHVFQMSSNVDASGHFVTKDHAIVTFWMEDITSLDLNDFNCQNVISCLQINYQDGGFQLELGGCYGVQGSVSARSLRASLESGIPEDSGHSWGARQ